MMVILDCLKESIVSFQRCAHIEHDTPRPTIRHLKPVLQKHHQQTSQQPLRSPSPGCHCSCHQPRTDLEHYGLYSKDKSESTVLANRGGGGVGYRRSSQSSCYAASPTERLLLDSSRDSNYCDISDIYYSGSFPNGNYSKLKPYQRQKRPQNVLHLTRINPFKFATTMDLLRVDSRLIVFSLVDSFTKLSPNKTFENYVRKLKDEGKRVITIFNLSEPVEYLKQNLNIPVCEFGWPERHTPSLEKLCNLCKAIDSWLALDSIRNTAVLYSKRDLSRASLAIAVFLQYIKICIADDSVFDLESMQNYYQHHLKQYLQPSQKRYVEYFKALLSGETRINNQQFYLNQIILKKIPNFEGNGLCKPFIKIYQGMSLIYSSPVASIDLDFVHHNDSIIFDLNPPLKLRGEILIKWYHKRINPTSRSSMFSVQFHTGTLTSNAVMFEKDQLDIAIYDKRFHPSTNLQLFFNDIKMDNFQNLHFEPDDEITKWNSYENFCTDDMNLEYTKGPLDGSLYATVTKRPSSNPRLNTAASSDDITILDELLKGILIEIDSFPDLPASSTTGKQNRLSSNSIEEVMHSSSTPPPLNDASEDSSSQDRVDSPTDSELTWLQKQQIKLRNKQNRTEQRRTLMEKRLIEELKGTIKTPKAKKEDDARLPEVPVRTSSRHITTFHSLPQPTVDEFDNSTITTSEYSRLDFSPRFESTPERAIGSEPSYHRDGPDSVSPYSTLHSEHNGKLPNTRAVTPSFPVKESRHSTHFAKDEEPTANNALFVKDTSQYWYKPNISREDVVKILREKPSGSFIIRDSNSFQGAYGLAVKVGPFVHDSKPSQDSVRHFLIESTSKGVQIKGCPEEPVFGSLAALVHQHSITRISLPIKLTIPDRDVENEDDDTFLLRSYGAACNVLYFGSEDVESLTGLIAVKKVVDKLFDDPKSVQPIVVHFNASNKGITLTDNSHKMFFRLHYPLKTISYCALDPEYRTWTHKMDAESIDSSLFGFVAQKKGSIGENICLIFGQFEHDQPSYAIVDFISKLKTF